MVLEKRHDIGPDDDGGDGRDGEFDDVARDPVHFLRDVQEEGGDEAGLTDTYSLDSVGAAQMGVALDSTGDEEAMLD